VKLEEVTAEIRPRVPWESIDLGCALARRHIGSIWKAWALTVIPLWILLGVLLRDHPWWFILITWWLKPIYDRVPLLVVSRALFGAIPSVKEVLKSWPKLMVKRLWFALVVGRFSPARSLSLPVSELEGLKGSSYRQRVNLLERNGGEGATMATLAGLVLEVGVGAGLVMLVLMMAPADVSSQWWTGISEFFEYSDASEITDSFLWSMALVRLLSFMLMEPFYVSAGFALYVNSRTLTEGWDIELAFKRMGTRLEGLRSTGKNGRGVMLVLFACVGLGMSTPSLHAENDSQQEQVQQILADEDFTIHDRIDEVPVDSSSSSSSSSGSSGGALAILAFLGPIMFYTILAAIIGGLIYLIYRNRHIFQSDGIAQISDEGTKTLEVMGMDVRPESLPADVVAAARTAWGEGDYQLALSLLYRGSLIWLVHRADLPIAGSDTESDCLRHVEAMQNAQLTPYFSNLTRAWISAAYGKENPDDSTMHNLCETWPFQEVGQKNGGSKR